MNNRYDWICSTEDRIHYDTDDIFLHFYYGFERPVHPPCIYVITAHKPVEVVITEETEIEVEEGE